MSPTRRGGFCLEMGARESGRRVWAVLFIANRLLTVFVWMEWNLRIGKGRGVSFCGPMAGDLLVWVSQLNFLISDIEPSKTCLEIKLSGLFLKL